VGIPNIRQLLLPKLLYERGAATLRSGRMFDAGIALSLFHDAVEITCAATARTLGVPAKKADFIEFWKLVKDREVARVERGEAVPPEVRELPMQRDMESLNKARILYKHEGQVLLDHAEVETHRINCHEFLRRTYEIFWSQVFDSLSMISLVPYKEVRETLKQAERLLEESSLDAALAECVKAHSKITKLHAPLVDQGFLVSFPQIDQTVKKYVDQQNGHLRQHIRRIGELTLAGIFGVNVVDWAIATETMTRVREDAQNREEIASDPPRRVRFCIEVLAEFAIKQQDVMRALERPEWTQE
jgi:hypothetical protein